MRKNGIVLIQCNIKAQGIFINARHNYNPHIGVNVFKFQRLHFPQVTKSLNYLVLCTYVMYVCMYVCMYVRT